MAETRVTNGFGRDQEAPQEAPQEAVEAAGAMIVHYSAVGGARSIGPFRRHDGTHPMRRSLFATLPQAGQAG